MGITEGVIILNDPLTAGSGSNPTGWILLNEQSHPARVRPKVIVTPKSKISGFVAWVDAVVPATAVGYKWKFRVSYSGSPRPGDGVEGDNVGYVATSTWN